LKSRTGAILPLFSSSQYAEARSLAAEVARHLRLDIEDASSDHPVRLSPDQADLSLQHRLRLQHEKEPPVDRPAAAASEVTNEAGVIRIQIPSGRLHPVALACMLIPVVVPLFMFAPLSQFFRQTRTPGFVGWFFLGFLVLMFGVMPASAAFHAFLSSRVGRTVVSVSPSGIRIQRRKVWRTRMLASHEAADIMDIDFGTTERLLISSSEIGERTRRVITALSRLSKGRGITIKTRQGWTTFGEGLADDEIRYLHSIVRRALIGVG
jgi:hypothetical protein